MEQFSWEPLAKRQADFREWCETVRDPATVASEGLRTVRTRDGNAKAEYDIARLPDGWFAIRHVCEYRCGDHFGMATPWTDYPTREEAVAAFLAEARRHFGRVLRGSCVSASQRRAQLEMQHLLGNDLFGFIEPEPSRDEPAPDEDSESAVA